MVGNPPPPACPTPWVATSRAMTAKAGPHTYEQWKAGGWTDELLIQHGYMENPNMSFPPLSPIAEPTRSLDKIHKDLLARTEASRLANENAANLRDQLREVRDEYNAACSYYIGEANRELAS